MNEQAIIDSYNVFVSQGYTKSLEEYKKLIATNPNALQDSYNAFASQGYGKSIDDYKVLMGIGQSPSVEKKSPVVTALPAAGTSSAVQSTPEKTKEDEEEDYFKGAFGDVLRGIDKFSPIGIGDFVDDMARSVASGYRQGTQAQEADKLLLKGTKATPEQIQKFIDANKNAQALAPSKEMQDYQRIYEEEGKGFWGVIKGLANNPSIMPEVITSSLVGMATNADALKAAAAVVGTGAAYGAVTGAAATPEFLGAGAIPGATAGATAAIPYAFGLASSVVEMGSTFGELLKEELQGKEMTKENVKAILENPEKLNSIRNKAIARGAIIGTVDAATGKLASGVGAKILTKSAAKSSTGAVTRGAVTKAAATGSAVEALGGSLGEATARAATGQDLDVSEIALEGIGELPGGIRSTIQARFAKPSYKINGEKVSAEEVDDIINTMDPSDLAKTDIEIKNDYEGREFKMRDKVLTHTIKQEVKQANPDLNEPSLNAIAELEKELKTLENNKTQTGKDKAAAIKEKIKNIQENQLPEEVDTETEQSQAITDEKDAFQEILDNPDNHDEADVQEAKDYFADPIKYYEEKIKFYEEEVNPTEDDKASLEYFKKMFEAHKAAEVKPETKTIKAGEGVGVIETTPETITTPAPAKGTTITIGAGGATVSEGRPTEVTTGGEGTETKTSSVETTAKALEEAGEENKSSLVNAASNIFEDAGYHVGNLQEKADYATDSYHGDMPFTGYYFVSDPNKVIGKESRRTSKKGFKVVDFSKYNLLKLTTPQYWVVKNALKKLAVDLRNNGLTVEESIEKNSRGYGYSQMLEYWMPDFLNKLKNTNLSSELNDYVKEVNKDNYKTERLETRILKKMGYEGIDVRDAKETSDEASPDSFTEGSVIFDLKEGTVSDPAQSYHEALKVPEQERTEQQKKLVSSVEKITGKPEGTTVTVGAGGATVSEGKPTEVTTGGEGTETKTSGTDIVKTKKNEDNEHVVTLNGEEVGKIYYDPSQKTWNNANFSRAGEKPYTAKWIYGDVLGESKQQAIDEVIKRHKESAPKKEEPQKVQYTKDNILNRFLNKLNELNPLQKNPIDNKSFVYGDKASLEFNRFDKGDKNEVALESIMSLDKNKGAGSAVMKDITAAADALGVKLTLDAKPFGREGLTKQQLVDFYKKNGFKVDFEDAYGGEFKSEQELLDYALQHESEAIPMSREPKTSTEIKAGEGVGVSEGKPTEFTMAEGRETKTGVMDDIELLIPKYKEYVDRDLQKAKDKYRINKSEANKKALDKAKAAAEEYKKEVADKKEEALKLLTESSEYKNADPTQQDALVKEVLRKFGERIKKAPSAETILGIEPPKVVTMTEKAALKEQIKAFARGVKEGLKTAKDLMERRKVFAAAINQIEKSGLISSSKVSSLLNKISKVNLEDDAAVEKVIEYAEKLFADAEYDNKLNAANNERGAIKKLASNKKKNADLSVFAKKFLKIRPSDVENIDEYNEMAKKIRESLEGSKITKDKNNPIKLADMIDIAKMGDYVDKMLEAQAKIDKDKLIKSARGIMGDDATFLSDDEVLELIKTGQVEKNEKVDDSLLKKITERVDRIFESSAAMVEEILRTGKDPLTGEDIDLSEGRKKIVERFMSMDMKDLSDREKLGVIDALNNFIRNGSVANMETVYADYKAKDSLAKAIENNVVAKKLKLFFSKKTGRAFGQQISTLPNLAEQMFRGVEASKEFKRLSGITDLVNKKAAVQRTMNVLTDSFIKEFYNQKANGKAFDTAENVAERGIIAAMKRDIPGTPEQQKAEFVRKKKLAEKSIELLRDGNEQERKLADVYQKAYDKVLKDSNTVDEVLKKSDDKNIEAVDWWIDKWSDIYDQLAEVTEGIYNEKLDRDLNYTNFKFSFLSGGAKAPELSSRESVFLNSNNDIFGKGVYKKKAGVLEKSTRPEADGMEDMYFDLSFDRNMINAYQDALMDINTAGTVRQIESFFSSKAIKKIIPNKEDRDLLFRNNGKEGVVPDLIRTTRQRQVVQTDELTSVLRKLSNLGTAGAATALAGVTQPIKQTIPVAINTLINAGKMPDLFYFRNKDKVDFINNSQRAIAIRGGKSRVNVDSINKLAEAAATSKTTKAIEMLGKINEIALKTLVEKPDVWIAKASWITYYEKALKKQGTDPNKIDWKTHEINDAAADYAQDMVDRQQNISDADLQGKLMNTKDPLKSVMVKTVMPFASFRMNQTMRMYSDLKTAFSKKGQATKEDRVTAIKSLAGYSAEMASFKYLQYFIASTLATAAVEAMGINETDDDKKKREEILKRSQTTGTVTDIFSPLPMLDLPVAIGADKALSYFQDLEGIDEEDKFNLMTSVKQNGAKSLGLYGIAIDKANSIIEAFEISTTGKYTDEYGREKYVSNKTANALGDIALMSTGSSLIGFPSEMNAVLRNSLRLAKKNSSTKPGGKEAYVRQSSERRTEVLKKKEAKMKVEVEALNRMLREELDPIKIKEIRSKIREAKEAPYKRTEQSEEEKLTRKEEKEKMEEMLQGYNSKSDMERYDTDLYEKTFGEGSDYYEENKAENEVKSDLSKEKKQMKDEEYNYYKSKKRKKNKDGTYKKKYFRSYYRGN